MSFCRPFKWRACFSLLAFSLLLSACGGGGSGSSPGFIGGGGGPDEGPASTVSIRLTLTDSTGMPTTTVTDVELGLLTVEVTNLNGPVANEVVTVSTTVGSLAPASGSALTDAEGKATVAVLSNGQTGAGTLTASVTIGADTATANLNFQVGEDPRVGQLREVGAIVLALTDSDGMDRTTITDVDFGLLEITVTNLAGEPAAGEVVTVSTTIGQLEPATVLTNRNGRATVAVFFDGQTGAGTLTASVASGTGTVTETRNFEIEEEPRAGQSDEAASIDLTLRRSNSRFTSTYITDVDFGVLTIEVTNLAGGPVENAVVTVSTTIGRLEFATALTNRFGRATVAVFSAGQAEAGTLTASVAASTGPVTADLNFEIREDPQAGSILLTLTRSDGTTPIATITEEELGLLTIEVTDREGDPVPDEVVTISTTIGSVAPTTALTDEDGVATVAVLSAGQTGGGTLTTSVTIDAATVTASLNFRVGDDPPVGNEPGSIRLTLRDSSNSVTSTITDVESGRLTIEVRDLAGRLLRENTVVTIHTTIGRLDSATALTDRFGRATVAIFSDGQAGAGTLTVSAGQVTETLNFEVGQADLRIGRIDEDDDFIPGEIEVEDTSLSATSSIRLTIAVVDADDVPVTAPVEVSFSSRCAGLAPPTAELSASASTVAGMATAIYTVNGCVGQDTVTAALVGRRDRTASVTLTIAPAAIGSIAFRSATPTTLALRGTGGQGRLETATVEFQVLDITGAPVRDVEVRFSLSTTAGGLALTNANDSITTDDEGIARAFVQAGNIATSVRVRAAVTVDGVELATVSDRLIVSTGLPDQNSFSLSVEDLNPGGGDLDGVRNRITVRMADKFNNPVPDGTAVVFTTEFGAIESSCETLGGQCSVFWISQAPRESLNYPEFTADISNRPCPTTRATGFPCPDFLGEIARNRTTVLATAIGEESFIDSNANGRWDLDESHQDLPEAFLDNNENGEYDGSSRCTDKLDQTERDTVLEELDNTERDTVLEVNTLSSLCASGLEETFVDFDGNGAYDGGNGMYNGTLCPEDLAATGDCTRELVSVGGSIAFNFANRLLGLVLTGPAPANNVIPGNLPLPPLTSATTYHVYISDRFNVRPASDAALTVSSDGACEIVSLGAIPNNSPGATGALPYRLVLEPDLENVEADSGVITFTLTAGDGSQSSVQYSCTDPVG